MISSLSNQAVSRSLWNPGSSWPHSQEQAISPCPEINPALTPSSFSWKFILIIPFLLHLILVNDRSNHEKQWQGNRTFVIVNHISKLSFLTKGVRKYLNILYSGMWRHIISYTCTKCPTSLLPFGPVRKFWKATISSVTSVYPHGRTRLPQDGFWWNLIVDSFSKIFRPDSSFIKIRQE